MSELGELFEDVAERIFSDFVTQDLLESAERGEWSAELWKAVEEAGLTRARLPEGSGGAGASWPDLYPIIAASGRHAAPIPLAECMLAAGLLHRAGLSLPAGVVTLAEESLDPGNFSNDLLTATLKSVPWGRHARHVVVVAPSGDRNRISIIDLEGAEIEHRQNLAREPRDVVKLKGAHVVASAETRMPLNRVRLYGAMIRSAQMAGALEALLEMSVGYANERVQFGRPIGKFQAIQQEMARLAGEVAASGMAAKMAFHSIDRTADDTEFDPTFEIAAAKIRLGDAADLAPGIAHQVHGAIGFTYEHKLHFFTRRLWSWRAEYGTAAQWADRLGAMALEKGAQGLWPWVTSR